MGIGIKLRWLFGPKKLIKLIKLIGPVVPGLAKCWIAVRTGARIGGVWPIAG